MPGRTFHDANSRVLRRSKKDGRFSIRTVLHYVSPSPEFANKFFTGPIEPHDANAEVKFRRRLVGRRIAEFLTLSRSVLPVLPSCIFACHNFFANGRAENSRTASPFSAGNDLTSPGPGVW